MHLLSFEGIGWPGATIIAILIQWILVISFEITNFVLLNGFTKRVFPGDMTDMGFLFIGYGGIFMFSVSVQILVAVLAV